MKYDYLLALSMIISATIVAVALIYSASRTISLEKIQIDGDSSNYQKIVPEQSSACSI